MMKVTAEGSSSTGTIRPYGLDCSGFVTWAFINSGMNENAIGHGTEWQVANATRISWTSAEPGDLAFYNDLSHVGIVVGKDASGNLLVIHCSSGQNNVTVSTVTDVDFGFCSRPSALN